MGPNSRPPAANGTRDAGRVWAELHAAPGATEESVARSLADTGIEADLDVGAVVWRRAAMAYPASATRRRAYLAHPALGPNLQHSVDALLTRDPLDPPGHPRLALGVVLPTGVVHALRATEGEPLHLTEAAGGG